MTGARVGAVAALLLLASCGSTSSPRSSVVATTTTTPHAVTFSLRPVETTSTPPCRSPLVAGTAKPPTCYRLGAPIIGRADVESAQASYNANGPDWEVDLTVTDAAEARFAAGMQKNTGRDVAIVFDGRVIVAPRINEGIVGKNVTITGSFDEQTAERIAADLTKPVPPNPRQHATACTKADLNFASPTQVPPYRRLAKVGSYWFGRVQLDPPSTAANPTFSLAQAWGAPLSGAVYSSAIYDVVLSDWTSDANLFLDGKAAPHDHVLAWVIIGKHVPVAASDVGTATTVPGVPCYFGTSIAAVDATTGKLIASSIDYSG